MSRARNLANLLNSSGDVKSDRLDNVPVYADVSGSSSGLMPTAMKSKLDAIEANATADQTGAEILALFSNSITAGHIAAGAIGASELGDAVVNSQHYASGSIDRVHLANDIIDGSKIANDVINSEHYADNSIDALHLNVSGNGTTSQYLRSDGDGSMSWVTPPDTNTTYTAGTGMSLSGTTFNCNINTPAEVGLGNLSSNGNALSGSFTATGNITAYSDLRLKNNIEVIDDALAKVMSLRGVNFDMNGERSTGVIAQELEQVLPEAVFDNEDGMKSVAYGNIVGLLIESIKELSAKVEELENK